VRWLIYALGAAAANATAGTLAKAGLEKVQPAVAVAVTTVVAAATTSAIVFVTGDLSKVRDIDAKSWLWLALAGVVTTLSFVLYFRALGDGESSRVQPIDRLSLVFAVVLAAAFLRERITARLVVGALMMAAGAVVVATSASR
jgi:transporter family protein